MSDPVRCAVIGLGWMGSLHAAWLAGTPLADLALACDVAASPVGALPGLRVTADLEEALDTPGLEAVVICTPPDAHREAVLAALEHDLHVLCEKPIATTLEDADAMIEAARRSSGRLAIGHIRRFDPRFLAIGEAVADGRVGRPLHMSGGSSCPREDAVRLGGHVTLALECGVHDLDIMRWLAGDVIRVHAEAVDAYGTPGGDAFCATVRFASGAVGALQHTWAMPDGNGIEWEFRFQVAGENGLADIDGRSRGGVSIHAAPPTVVYPDALTWPTVHGQIAGVLDIEDGHFLAGVRDGRAWPVTPEDARAAVAAALAIDRSAAEGRPIDL